jgi:hypothetical protein
MRSENMKTSTAIALAAAFLTTATPAFAAKEGKNTARAQQEASCKAQAAKKFSAIHFMKRHDFVNRCMGVTNTAKAKKVQPTTTGQATH